MHVQVIIFSIVRHGFNKLCFFTLLLLLLLLLHIAAYVLSYESQRDFSMARRIRYLPLIDVCVCVCSCFFRSYYYDYYFSSFFAFVLHTLGVHAFFIAMHTDR